MPPSKNAAFRKGFKSFAEKTSVELRVALNIKPSHPLPAIRLAEHLKVLVTYPSQIPGIDTQLLQLLQRGRSSHWSGVTLKVEKGHLVIVNEAHSKARQESDLMHELAHLICNHEMGTFAMLNDGITLRDFDDQQEKEAEWLGGCLQLPRVALHYHFKEYGLSVEEIALKFNASIEMVRFRLNVCGLVKKYRA